MRVLLCCFKKLKDLDVVGPVDLGTYPPQDQLGGVNGPGQPVEDRWTDRWRASAARCTEAYWYT